MEELCRICLDLNLAIDCFHISYLIIGNKTISKAIQELSSLNFEDDGLSKYICKKCYDQLLIVENFRELIIKSDTSLRQGINDKVVFYTKANEYNCGGTEIAKSEANCDNANNKTVTDLNFEDPFNDLDDSSESDNVTNEILFEKCEINRTNSGRKHSGLPRENRKVHKFECNICYKILYGRSNRLEQHIIMAHSDIKNFECDVCDKKFKSKQQLVNHQRVHTGEKPYKCNVCQDCFATSQNLFNHKKKHTGNLKIYKCQDCEKGYSTPGELETHRRTVHTGERPFLCEICSRAYSSTRNLKLHIRSVHEKTEKCPKCGLMQSVKRIKQHMQKHQDKERGIRRFTCDKCGKGFFTPDAIKKHQVVHTGEKPFLCQICFKSFGQKSAVDTHMKTHSDVRSFCCCFCAKTFKYKQHMQIHVKKHHRSDDEKKEKSPSADE